MRYVSLRNAKPGMQLANSLYDDCGRILVNGDMCLTEKYIHKLNFDNYSCYRLV